MTLAHDSNQPNNCKAPLLTVASASGGVGKSAIAITAANLCARSGLLAALVEADLQFGDLGFWLDLETAQPTLACGLETTPLHIARNLDLFKAPCFPELAESISDEVAVLVSRLRNQYGLVIADTGGFWSGLTADLIVNADIFALVADQRPSSIAGTVRAIELCQRMGAADARRACVYNRLSSRARLNAGEAKSILGTPELYCIPEGKRVVDELLCAGNVAELIEMENPFARGVDELLARVLPKAGIDYRACIDKHRRRWAL